MARCKPTLAPPPGSWKVVKAGLVVPSMTCIRKEKKKKGRKKKTLKRCRTSMSLLPSCLGDFQVLGEVWLVHTSPRPDPALAAGQGLNWRRQRARGAAEALGRLVGAERGFGGSWPLLARRCRRSLLSDLRVIESSAVSFEWKAECTTGF